MKLEFASVIILVGFMGICGTGFAKDLNDKWDTVGKTDTGDTFEIHDSDEIIYRSMFEMNDGDDGFVGFDFNNDFDVSVEGDYLTERVIGKYPREQINNNSSFPFRAVGYIVSKKPDGTYSSCSGTLVGPRHVLTAAHCLFQSDAYGSNDTHGWNEDITFTAGRNGNDLPYEKIRYKSVFVVQGYSRDNDAEYDYGMIILRDDIGEKAGYLGYKNLSDIVGTKVNFLGYPGDKPSATMWRAYCPFESRYLTDRQVSHKCDSYGGMSGGPMYVFDGDNRQIVSINISSSNSEPYNFARRITQNVVEKIRKWKSEN